MRIKWKTGIDMKAKYAIFQTNEDGSRAWGLAIAVGEAEVTEDWFADRRAAIIDGLAKLQKCAPEDVKDAGFHTAEHLEGYRAQQKNLLADLLAENHILEGH